VSECAALGREPFAQLLNCPGLKGSEVAIYRTPRLLFWRRAGGATSIDSRFSRPDVSSWR
jgi:hypothetical protein